MGNPPAGEFSAAPASTGASGAIMSRASSALKSGESASNSAGSRGNAIAAPFASRQQAGAACATHSASNWIKRRPQEKALADAVYVADGFFFGLGFTALGCATGSGPRSIDDRRPAVKV